MAEPAEPRTDPPLETSAMVTQVLDSIADTAVAMILETERVVRIDERAKAVDALRDLNTEAIRNPIWHEGVRAAIERLLK